MRTQTVEVAETGPFVHPKAVQYMPGPLQTPRKHPKYLVRDADGAVFTYNAERAAQFGMTPTNTLPAAHVERIKAAQIRDEEERVAIANATARAERDQSERNVAAQQRLDEALSEGAKSKSDAGEQFVVDEKFLAQASRSKLTSYARQNFGVDLDSTLALDVLRDHVRELCNDRRQNL